MTTTHKVTMAALCAMLTAAGAAAQSPATHKLKETPLTLSGCVGQGERPDSFLIRNIKVSGAGVASAPAGAYYRLDTTKGLAAHVNHQVEISGHADLADIDSGTVTTKTDAAGQSTTSLNSERRTVTAKDTPVWAGSPGTETTVKVPVNTYGFKVDSVKMISSTCS